MTTERVGRLMRAMAAMGVPRSDRSAIWYDPALALHEAAHALDLGLQLYDTISINAALLSLPAAKRRRAEVTACAAQMIATDALGLSTQWDSDAMARAVVRSALDQPPPRGARPRWSARALARDIRAAMKTARAQSLAARVLSMETVTRSEGEFRRADALRARRALATAVRS